MTLRRKIWFLYIISILVPVVILVGSVFYFTTTVKSHVDQELEAIRSMYTEEPIDNLLEAITSEISQNPESIQDEKYLEFIESSIQMTPFEIKFFRDGEEVLYLEQLRNHGSNSIKIARQGIFKDKNNQEYRYQVTIRERDPKESFVARYNHNLIRNGIMFVIVYLILHLIFFKYSIRTIFAPLKQMKDAAISIRDEHYDEPLNYSGQDEVGEVFHAFEEMRIRIKASDEMRQEYEVNRKELIANISHDLKTPITAINGYVQGIIDGVANTEDKLQSYVETIAVYGRDMDTLIDDLSLLSKLDIDGVLFQFEPIRVQDYVRDCVEELSFDLEEKGVTLKLDFNGREETKVNLDGVQMKRVFNNIIFNALKHFDKEKAILEVLLREDGQSVTISIRDNGIGIPQDKVENIFERFYRVDPSRNSETGGSGLGLSIAQQIVKAHGGTILAESEKGVGTTIEVSLPMLLEV